jgi:hypothetical protein
MKVARLVIGMAVALVAMSGVSDEVARALEIVTPECVYGAINDLDGSLESREYVPRSLWTASPKATAVSFSTNVSIDCSVEAPGKRGSLITKKTVTKRFTVDDGTVSVTQSVALVLTPASVSAAKRCGYWRSATASRRRTCATARARSWRVELVDVSGGSFRERHLDRDKTTFASWRSARSTCGAAGRFSTREPTA